MWIKNTSSMLEKLFVSLFQFDMEATIASGTAEREMVFEVKQHKFYNKTKQLYQWL